MEKMLNIKKKLNVSFDQKYYYKLTLKNMKL